MQICLYEDTNYRNFFPITHTRPLYTVRVGILPLHERIRRWFTPETVSFAVREDLAPLIVERTPEFPVNIIKHSGQPVLFVNGRLRDPGNMRELIDGARFVSLLKSGDETVGVYFPATAVTELPSVVTPDQYADYLAKRRDSAQEIPTTATTYGHLWDLIEDIDGEIAADFAHLESSFTRTDYTVHNGAHLINQQEIYIGEGSTLMPTAVLDASKGAIYLSENVRVDPHAAIIGPCFVGPHSIVLAGKIAGSSIGPMSRVGGEVEESIFLGNVNKYHAGFIGHSVVGSWVNFGAMTTNSDLKNNYSTIRVSVNGEMVDSGSIKVGSFIGDHTKFGIGTLLNTGISIGPACNIFGGSLVTDKEVPAFSWGNSAKWSKYEFDKVIETATRTAIRRDRTLSEHEIALLRKLSDGKVSASGTMSW